VKKIALLFLAALLVSASAFAQSSVLSDLQAARAHYGTPMSPEEQAALLNAVAFLHRLEGVGLEKKSGGSTCPQPVTGIRVACDILRFPGDVGRDVLGDTDGAGIPQWGAPGAANPATFVPPVSPVIDPPPPIDPPAPVPSAATADLQQQQLTLLLQIVGKLETQLEQQQAQSAKLEAAIRDLKAEIAKGIKVRF
jgi:hypothetical protein